MAKLITDTIIVKVSRMIRDDDKESAVLPPDAVEALSAIIGELAGSDVLVEVYTDVGAE